MRRKHFVVGINVPDEMSDDEMIEWIHKAVSCIGSPHWMDRFYIEPNTVTVEEFV